MSLNISLTVKDPIIKEMSSGIFIRENGETKEISQEEWNERHYGELPIKFISNNEETYKVYSANITHNLGQMANEAGIYKHLWRPEEIGITKASELIESLTIGLNKLKFDKEKYKVFNPDNGWGSYEGLVSFVENYLNACKKYPDAEIYADR
jgi:hypothetical protein